MSGGVDSSVATALLAGQGFDVVGSMLRFWPDEGHGAFEVCCSPEAAFDARRIADRLDVPFYLLDARDDFERVVIAPFVPAYARGETPNPCVWCNREIKFGAFAERARRLGCDFMATGPLRAPGRRPRGVELHRGLDDDKDQTYFLWALPRRVLPYLLFPLGDLTKAQVREMAVERKLPVAWKPSSSGLCFIGGSVEAYLSEHVEAQPGPSSTSRRAARWSASTAACRSTRSARSAGWACGSRTSLAGWSISTPERNAVLVGPREACTWTTLTAGRRTGSPTSTSCRRACWRRCATASAPSPPR
jgi:tRNA-uridine 2-sulfurtransferase